ncbi:hypothetical protein [Natranaerobius thermophilus]|uniref:Uncharacterized protein n=1 Tax=Natranaerobius thermophilus (strain ATCC BAA-1301 / DSM 18059 / JW/NM-WN-LF) TaxID=457570 RepID=B2A207_NATTJ|nr:hypothetical protein [Natranaerobius thermophilus]ACB84812.1 conserved hypothetical protein [Natranaerobius thermophilus JW/NM-WN-LF]
MTNLERLKMEIKDIEVHEQELKVYLEENQLKPDEEYKTDSPINKRRIYQTALSILESLANSPTTMKRYTHEDMTVSQFAENLQNRIDQLERTIRQLSVSDSHNKKSSTFMLFKE